MSEATEQTWRCDTCGTEYITDIGKCGQLQPPCDGTVQRVEPPTAQDVVDALRFLLAEQDDPAEAVRIANAVLTYAPETDADRGISLILRLIAEGSLKVALT